MTSYDDGDNWIVDSLEDAEVMQADLTHDGTPEKLYITASDQRMGIYCNDGDFPLPEGRGGLSAVLHPLDGRRAL